ncbi:major capsid protein [Ralstonia syzygii]|uniref:Putative prophage-derived major coat protein n=1 Tax=Ralstonia syzygii R24 TaxID=907261 RepID=G3A0F3_9RALS|nr:major capsid protein [Ralstonia syzygii]CCA84650.1 putative prophage-derived major coat protein [Ralstonia syzygii R24]
MKSVLQKVGVGAGIAAAAGSALADGPDVSAVVTTIGTGVAAVAAIGVAVLSVIATIAIYQWVKRPIK